MIERTDGVVRLRVDPWKIWLAWGWGVPVGAVCLVGGLVIAVATGTGSRANVGLAVIFAVVFSVIGIVAIVIGLREVPRHQYPVIEVSSAEIRRVAPDGASEAVERSRTALAIYRYRIPNRVQDGYSMLSLRDGSGAHLSDWPLSPLVTAKPMKEFLQAVDIPGDVAAGSELPG